MNGATGTIARAHRDAASAAAAPGAGPAAKPRSLTAAAVRAAIPLWLLFAGLLAATMGTWPPHLYL